MEVRGVAGHASQPDQGRNAVIELAHQLLATKELSASIPGAQLTWTKVIAEQPFNQIPEFAVALGDGRITATGADAKLLEALEEQVGASKLVEGTEVSVSLEILRPMLLPTPGSREILEIADRIHAEIGLPAFYRVEMAKASTDAGYAAISGTAAVLESLGPSGDGYHGADEHILVPSIKPRLYLTARLLIELAAAR